MTRERAKELLPVIQEFAEGKTVEYFQHGKWHFTNEPLWEFSVNDDCKYRIKPTLTMRPWKPEEVPVGALLKHNRKECTYMIVGVENGVVFVRDTQYSLESMLLHWQHSLDHGRTWLPCGVQEEATP